MMTSDSVGSALAMKQAQMMFSAQATMMRQQHQMDMAMIEMLTQSAEAGKVRAAPPAGTGLRVDKTA